MLRWLVVAQNEANPLQRGQMCNKISVGVVASTALLLLGAVTASAQTAIVRVKSDQTIIWAPRFVVILTTVKSGTELEAVSRDGDWYQVLIPRPGASQQKQIGFVAGSQVELVGNSRPPETPTDPLGPPRPTSKGASRPTEQPATPSSTGAAAVPAPPIAGSPLVISAEAPLFSTAERIGAPLLTLPIGTAVRFLGLERGSYRVEFAARSAEPRGAFVDPRLVIPALDLSIPYLKKK
jgi:hypothetical protein